MAATVATRKLATETQEVVFEGTEEGARKQEREGISECSQKLMRAPELQPQPRS